MKCLVMMHQPISNSSSGGKTLATMLSCFCKEELCQIYLKDIERDYSLCSSFFLIDELEMLKNIFRTNSRTGKEIFQDKGKPDIVNNSHSIGIGFSLSRLPLTIMIRNIAWRNSRWRSDNLDNWLEKEKPEIILLVPGYILGVIECAKYVAGRFDIPIATFVTDDYFSKSHSFNLLGNYLNRKLNDSYKSLLNYSDLHYVIGDGMASLYRMQFGVEHISIMNCVDTELQITAKKLSRDSMKIVYLGGIGLGRFLSLCDIAKAVDTVNRRGKRVELFLYCKDISKGERKRLESFRGCKYCGFVQGENLKRAVEKADVLIHIESFQKKYKKILSTAVSTKLPEYMNSGRLIFVYGPAYAESVNLIIRNKIGVGVSQRNVNIIAKEIVKIMDNHNWFRTYISAAKAYADNHYSLKRNSKMIYEQLTGSCKDKYIICGTEK